VDPSSIAATDYLVWPLPYGLETRGSQLVGTAHGTVSPVPTGSGKLRLLVPSSRELPRALTISKSAFALPTFATRRPVV
jgi:hypothetical protein